MEKSKHVFLTGPPGIGKTTLIKAAVEAIKHKSNVKGFYTEEIRNGRVRVGFDAVEINGVKRCQLARTDVDTLLLKNAPKVGKYVVFIDQFVEFVTPILRECPKDSLIVLDEVGKMELFSKNFQRQVDELLLRDDLTLFGTIPVRKGAGIPLVEKIRNSERVTCFEVNQQNRNSLLDDILALLL